MPYLAFLVLLFSSVAHATLAEREYIFRVTLDDRDIGRHTFRIAEESRHEQTVAISADLEVKLWMFTAFRYRHENTEHWSGDCLQRIQAETDSNGTRFQVSGEASTEGLRLDTISGGRTDQETLNGCIMSFAYWRPEILDQKSLLNSQDGSYLPVEIEALGQGAVEVRGKPVQANRYRLRAEGFNIELWYSQDNEWVGLASEVNGRQLVYQLD